MSASPPNPEPGARFIDWTVAETRANLREALMLADSGVTVRITKHGRLVAQITGIQEPDEVAWLRAQVATIEGLIERGTSAIERVGLEARLEAVQIELTELLQSGPGLEAR